MSDHQSAVNAESRTDNSAENEEHNISPAAVADYLSVHPDFFLNYPEVLAELHVHHQNKGVVSLTQMQLEQYRDKIKAQKKQLEKLVANAKRNETIYTTYAKLNLAIVKCEHFEQLENILQNELCDALGLTHAHVYPLVSQALPKEKVMSELQQRSLLDKKLKSSNYYFGRLGNNEKQLLFPNEVAESVALMSIGEQKPIAILAIASKNPLHFTPDMDTTLLDYLRGFMSFHLPKIL